MLSSDDLRPEHLSVLRQRAVLPEVIERRGYRSVSNAGALMAAGFPEKQAASLKRGMLIPRYGLHGRPVAPQFRPDQAGRNGPTVKYACPAGSWNFVDALPGLEWQKGADLHVSMEGPIKADAMTSAGANAVSIPGVWCWRSAGEPVLAFAVLAYKSRWFHLVCDSDFLQNPSVAIAALRLRAHLRNLGSQARILHPPGPGKEGVDDFLAAGGQLDGLVEANRSSLCVRRTLACRKLAEGWR